MPKYPARDIVFKIGDGATPSEVFTSLGQVRAIGEFGYSRGEIDATAFNEDWMDFLGGVKEGNVFDITLLLDPASTVHQGLETDASNTAARNFLAEHAPSSRKWTIHTRVMSFRVVADRTDALVAILGCRIIQPGVVGSAMP